MPDRLTISDILDEIGQASKDIEQSTTSITKTGEQIDKIRSQKYRFKSNR